MLGAVVFAVCVSLPLVGGRRASTLTAVPVRLQGNEFRPAEIRVRPGDTVRFVNGNGGPHNVMFIKDSIAPAARDLIARVMKDQLQPFTGPLLLDPDETYIFVVPAMDPDRYPLACLPHQANKRGALIVSR